MKYIIVILTISTIIAVLVALFSTKEAFDVAQILPSGTVEITFLIANKSEQSFELQIASISCGLKPT